MGSLSLLLLLLLLPTSIPLLIDSFPALAGVCCGQVARRWPTDIRVNATFKAISWSLQQDGITAIITTVIIIIIAVIAVVVAAMIIIG